MDSESLCLCAYFRNTGMVPLSHYDPCSETKCPDIPKQRTFVPLLHYHPTFANLLPNLHSHNMLPR